MAEQDERNRPESDEPGPAVTQPVSAHPAPPESPAQPGSAPLGTPESPPQPGSAPPESPAQPGSPTPGAGRRRGPDVLTLVVGLMSLAAATLVLGGWIPHLRLFDLRWVLSGGAVVLGVILLAGSVRSPRGQRTGDGPVHPPAADPVDRR